MFLKIPKLSYLLSLMTTTLSVILFFYTSFFTQINQILTVNLSISLKLQSIAEVIAKAVSAMGTFSGSLVILWIISLFIFYATFFGVMQKKKRSEFVIKNNNSKNTIVGSISFILSWLSFGCAACGHTLLISIITIFVTQISLSTLHSITAFMLMFSIIMLTYSSYKNYALLSNPNICPI